MKRIELDCDLCGKPATLTIDECIRNDREDYSNARHQTWQTVDLCNACMIKCFHNLMSSIRNADGGLHNLKGMIEAGLEGKGTTRKEVR